MLDRSSYDDARTKRRFYETATQRDRRLIGVLSPWKRPRRPDVTNRCLSWWQTILLQLPYRPTCPVEIGPYMLLTARNKKVISLLCLLYTSDAADE